MSYTFEILGVSSVLQFFNYQQEVLPQRPQTGVEYIGSYRCTLDALLASVETVSPDRGWDLDEAVDTIIDFWMHNIESVRHWKKRLEDAGNQNLLVTRLADVRSLKSEFEWLLRQ